MDDRPVRSNRIRKSVGGERTFHEDQHAPHDLRETLERIIEIVWERIERAEARGRTVTLKLKYNDWGAWAVLIAGVTPFPYKVITILSGVTALDPTVFTIASILARGLRFFVIAALIWKFGPVIREFIEKRLGLVFTIFIVVLVGGFAALKLIPHG